MARALHQLSAVQVYTKEWTQACCQAIARFVMSQESLAQVIAPADLSGLITISEAAARCLRHLHPR